LELPRPISGRATILLDFIEDSSSRLFLYKQASPAPVLISTIKVFANGMSMISWSYTALFLSELEYKNLKRGFESDQRAKRERLIQIFIALGGLIILLYKLAYPT
jgi:hypothetical protein